MGLNNFFHEGGNLNKIQLEDRRDSDRNDGSSGELWEKRLVELSGPRFGKLSHDLEKLFGQTTEETSMVLKAGESLDEVSTQPSRCVYKVTETWKAGKNKFLTWNSEVCTELNEAFDFPKAEDLFPWP
jgi:hypothetical protein